MIRSSGHGRPRVGYDVVQLSLMSSHLECGPESLALPQTDSRVSLQCISYTADVSQCVVFVRTSRCAAVRRGWVGS